jgi:hypothetical protein
MGLPAPRWKPDQVLLPSKTLRPAQRLAIYSEGYFLRLEECLGEDFKALRHLLGHDRFRRLVAAYLKRHPSRHYSLNSLGSRLPEFLQASRRYPRKKLLVDVARLEWTMTNLVDAAEPPSAARLAGLTPQRMLRARFRANPTLRVFEFSSPANAIVTAVRMERPLPPLKPCRTWLAVYRKDFTVWRMDLSEAMYGLLHALAMGRPFGLALEGVQKRWTGTAEELEAAVFASLRAWAAERFFAAIEFDRK